MLGNVQRQLSSTSDKNSVLHYTTVSVERPSMKSPIERRDALAIRGITVSATCVCVGVCVCKLKILIPNFITIHDPSIEILFRSVYSPLLYTQTSIYIEGLRHLVFIHM